MKRENGTKGVKADIVKMIDRDSMIKIRIPDHGYGSGIKV